MSASIRYACLFTAAAAASIAHADTTRETVLKQVDVRESTPSTLHLTSPSNAGSRLDIAPLQVPASVDVIQSETILARGQDSVMQAVTQNAVGFTVGSAPIYGSSYVARGFAYNDSIMQLYDGTRLYLGIGNITFPFDTWTVERVEVLHGPASVLGGEGAIGGVVNVVPKRPVAGEIRNEIKLSAGSDDTYGVALDSTGTLAKDWSYRVAASGRDSKGWVDYGDSSSETFAGSLQWQPLDELAITFATDYADQQPMAYFGTPLIDGHLDESLRDENYNVKNSKIQFKDSWNQLKAVWTPNESVELRNTIYLLHSRREWRNLEIYSSIGSGQILRNEYIHIVQSQNQLGNRFDATFESQLFGLDNAFVAGFDVNSADFAYNNNFNTDAFDLESIVPVEHFDHGYFAAQSATKAYSSTLDQRSLFVEDRLELQPNWSLIAGARYDHIEIDRDDRRNPSENLERTFDTGSWRLGTVFNPIENLSLYASFSTATDPVTSLLTLTPSEEQFDLSTGRQWEIGVKQALADGRVEWTASIFDIEKKKLLVRNPSDMMITDQIGKQSSTGIELAVSADLGANVRADVNATWLKAEYDKFTQIDFDTFEVASYAGNVPVGVPEQSANAWLTWDFMPRWDARVGVQYVGKAYQDYANAQVRDSYTVTHASLGWEPTEKIMLMLTAHNVFDRVYAETWHNSGNQWFLGQPRTLEVSARVKF